MSSYPKEIKPLNLLSNKKSPINKFSNRPSTKLGRIKSKEDRNQIPLETHLLYNKNAIINSIIEKSMLMKKLSQKANKSNKTKKEAFNSSSFKEKEKIKLKRKNLNFNQINNIINNDNNIKDKSADYLNNKLNTNKLKTISAKVKDINIENNILFGQNEIKLKKNFFDDIKIKNIICLWNELEVQFPYRQYFFFIYKQVDEDEQESLYQNEINELIELKNNIKNLTYNIELRIGLIKKLTELNAELNYEVKNNKNSKVNNFIINEMLNQIEKLTEQTVNIVLYMKKIKTQINMVTNLDKYNIDILSQKFKFDKNYIIKMKTETNFLREGYAKVFFNIKNEESPFFLKPCDKNKVTQNDPLTHVLSLNENMIKDIKECNYYIYKELIAYQNERPNKIVFRCISPLRKNNSAYNNFAKINFYNYNLISEEKKRENDNNKKKGQLIINGSGLDNINNKDNNKTNHLENERNSKDIVTNDTNDSARLINSFKNFYSIDNLSNNRRNKKMYTFNIKKKTNNEIAQFQNNYEKNKNKNYNPIINLSNPKSEKNINNERQIKILKERNRLPSFSPTNESDKQDSRNLEEDKKEE